MSLTPLGAGAVDKKKVGIWKQGERSHCRVGTKKIVRKTVIETENRHLNLIFTGSWCISYNMHTRLICETIHTRKLERLEFFEQIVHVLVI